MAPRFIFVVCQKGAEACCKQEIALYHPSLKLAFSRPGFITFKVEESAWPDRFHLISTFARTFGWSLYDSRSPSLQSQVEQVIACPKLAEANQLHVWQRDDSIPGSRGFEPGTSELAGVAAHAIRCAMAVCSGPQIPVNRTARVNELVLDVDLIEPNHWMIGYHYATAKFQKWPGGTPLIECEEDIISRGYFKLQEALLWSGIRIQANDQCAEIGSSPGGACQLLLKKGARIIAVDPAELDSQITTHPHLTHLRCRGKEIPKKSFKDVRWLICDVNAAPDYTLDMIAEIVNNQHVNKLRGLILTLKLSDWALADQIPRWRQQVQTWGFQWVKTRQLAFNRKEICLVALRDRFMLRKLQR